MMLLPSQLHHKTRSASRWCKFPFNQGDCKLPFNSEHIKSVRRSRSFSRSITLNSKDGRPSNISGQVKVNSWSPGAITSPPTTSCVHMVKVKSKEVLAKYLIQVKDAEHPNQNKTSEEKGREKIFKQILDHIILFQMMLASS